MYYCKEKQKARHYIFLWRSMTISCSSLRAYRCAIRYMALALPWNKDESVWTQGLPISWFTGPPSTCSLHKAIQKCIKYNENAFSLDYSPPLM
jgi:hypothetical protein